MQYHILNTTFKDCKNKREISYLLNVIQSNIEPIDFIGADEKLIIKLNNVISYHKNNNTYNHFVNTFKSILNNNNYNHLTLKNSLYKMIYKRLCHSYIQDFFIREYPYMVG